MSSSSSPLSGLVSAGPAAVGALRDAVRDGSWEDAVVSLEEIEQVAPSVPRGERELDQAVDALHHAVPPLRHDSAKADPNVPEKSIADLENSLRTSPWRPSAQDMNPPRTSFSTPNEILARPTSNHDGPTAG